jgi:catechol 2,3-dioxygenase-like lactoylglutathione lyase family enzyme
MLSELEIYAILPAKDLQRARGFYKDKLGLEPSEDRPDGLVFQTKSGAKFYMYETDNAGTAQNTAMSWETNDIEAEVAELRGRGIVFEEYDFPGLKTENGIATNENVRGAWFKDSEGNILAVSQGM